MKKNYVATINFLIEVDDDVFPKDDLEEIDNAVMAWLALIHDSVPLGPSFVVKKFELEDVLPHEDYPVFPTVE